MASTSNIPLQDLNNYFHGDFSFEIDNIYIDFAEKYFQKIDEKLSLENANSILSGYSLPFSTFFTPFIALAISELKDKNIMYKEFLENPICALIEKLFQISHKVLILEINVSRVLNANEELNT
ncbi:TPA: type 2 lantipeptide synthetase LanM, partial [Bacillus cereus]|nr:type 2 lantipeptide synthetase LanM [Bacillus cereus]